MSSWSWPVANKPPVPDSSYYQQRHPTRYTWRPDVEAWARWLVDNYDVWCNTYYDHPEGYWRTKDSIDIWGSGGRNDPIHRDVGEDVFSVLWNDPGLPNIDWIIWQRVIYGGWNYWHGEPFGDGTAFTNHEDHIHVTYRKD